MSKEHPMTNPAHDTLHKKTNTNSENIRELQTIQRGHQKNIEDMTAAVDKLTQLQTEHMTAHSFTDPQNKKTKNDLAALTKRTEPILKRCENREREAQEENHLNREKKLDLKVVIVGTVVAAVLISAAGWVAGRLSYITKAIATMHQQKAIDNADTE